jgi:hypothetical protein
MSDTPGKNQELVNHLKKLVKDIPVEVLGHIEAHALCCGDGTVALVKIEAKKTA